MTRQDETPSGMFWSQSYEILPNSPKQKARRMRRASKRARNEADRGRAPRGDLLLPSALFVAISFQALAALVLRHLETALLLEITHIEVVLNRATCGPRPGL
jgi:hypothetical protein